MADEELELDVKESKGGKKTVIMIVVGIMLINGIGIGAWLFLSGDKSSTTAKKEKVLDPIQYLTLVPEFVVNFGAKSKVRYLQVDLQISTRDASSLSIVSTYRPVLRNDILIILSDVSYEDLKDRSGKEALQKRLLNTINKVVNGATHAATDKNKKDAEHSTDTEGADKVVKGPIENVYYTNFIMQ